MKNAIVCCDNKKIVVDVLKFVKENFEIVCCIVDKKGDRVEAYCNNEKIEVVDKNEVYKLVERYEKKSIDLLITFSYPQKVSEDLINLGKLSINFHPAPLPEYRGRATVCHGIVNKEKKWGSTCHFLTKEFDEGDIIEVRKFEICEQTGYTGIELLNYSWRVCYEILIDVVKLYKEQGNISGEMQGIGEYYSLKDLESIKEIKYTDKKDVVSAKIKALWFPPFEGAYILIDGKKYYLIDEDIMEKCKKLYEPL